MERSQKHDCGVSFINSRERRNASKASIAQNKTYAYFSPMLDLATLAALHEKYPEAAALPVADFALGPHRFDFAKKPHLMGVVNLSAEPIARGDEKSKQSSAQQRAAAKGQSSIRDRPT